MTSTGAPYDPPGAGYGRPAHVGECILCGWAPSAPLELRRVTGMVLLWRTGTVSAPGLCRLCADKVFHDVQSHNLTAGWWGIIAPVVNVVALISNAARIRDHRTAAPTGSTRAADVATPLQGPQPFRTLWKRPGPWLGTGAAAALVGAVAWGAFVAPADRDASGAVVSAGTGAALSLQVDDCISAVSDEDDFSDVPLVPCSEPHVSQVFATAPMEQTSYPTDDELVAWVRVNCVPRFEGFVGLDYDSSTWEVNVIVPVESTWDSNKTVECLIETTDGSTWTGTARGSGV